MGILDDLKNALGLGPKVPTFGPPVPPRPRPIQVGLPTNTNTSPLVPDNQPSASLVGTHNNAKGRAQDSGSLVSGR